VPITYLTVVQGMLTTNKGKPTMWRRRKAYGSRQRGSQSTALWRAYAPTRRVGASLVERGQRRDQDGEGQKDTRGQVLKGARTTPRHARPSPRRRAYAEHLSPSNTAPVSDSSNLWKQLATARRAKRRPCVAPRQTSPGAT
jgi:hypothetical protein